MSPIAERYLELHCQLEHRLRNHRGEDATAEDLRERLDNLWIGLSEDDVRELQRRLRLLPLAHGAEGSAAMPTLVAGRTKQGSAVDQAAARAKADERRGCIITLLRLALAYHGSDLEEGILRAVQALRERP